MKLIVALDFASEDLAFALIEKLDPQQCALKVGSEMYTLLGPKFVKSLIAKHFKVFLDLKFHDIPNTVAHAVKAAANLGVWMLNVHASGGESMMYAAREALESNGKDRPYLIAVTMLTSLSQTDFYALGISSTLEEHILRLAQLTFNSGLDGVVCSALEVPLIKEKCGNNFLTVTPGIRLESNLKDDQNRIVTPRMALELGSDFLVVGRPITRALNPMAVVNEILTLGTP